MQIGNSAEPSLPDPTVPGVSCIPSRRQAAGEEMPVDGELGAGTGAIRFAAVCRLAGLDAKVCRKQCRTAFQRV
jgi:hypothetical protein